MNKYSTTTTFSFEHTVPSRALIVDANGGSVTVSAWDGTAWVIADIIQVDSVVEYFTAGLELQFVPLNGATFSIDLTLGVHDVVN